MEKKNEKQYLNKSLHINMVISPTELEKLTIGEEKMLIALEEEIDTRIRVDCEPRAKECHVNLKAYAPTRVQERIIDTYKTVGWPDVKFHESQREGYWVTFTK